MEPSVETAAGALFIRRLSWWLVAIALGLAAAAAAVAGAGEAFRPAVLTLLFGLSFLVVLVLVYCIRTLKRASGEGEVSLAEVARARSVVHAAFPLLLFLSGWRKAWVQQVKLSFVEINNVLVERWLRLAGPPGKLLVLLPHCLQWSGCSVKITQEIGKCASCGKCQVEALRRLSEEWAIPTFVATGGTLARKVVAETRPDLILAVACENDLSSGIFDTHPMPVVGLRNLRPNGPCQDTQVDLGAMVTWLESTLGSGRKEAAAR